MSNPLRTLRAKPTSSEMELARLIGREGDESKVDLNSWTTREVVVWLESLGLGVYGEAFKTHLITGDTLHLLTEAHLKELGVQRIGQRLIIVREATRLHRRAVDRIKFCTLWEADAVKYTDGCLDWALKQLCCLKCDFVEHYLLTGTHLHITELDPDSGSRFLRCCCTTAKRTRSIELASIASVEVFFRDSPLDCGCAADMIRVALSGGLPEVRLLSVEKGRGREVSRYIQEAVEEAQTNHHRESPAPADAVMR